MALVWVEAVICVDLIDSTHAQSKNGPQDTNAAGGSLGSWGLIPGSFLHGERGGGSSRVWPWTKPQNCSGVITMRVSCPRSEPVSTPRS